MKYRKVIIERTAKVLEVEAESEEQAEEKLWNGVIADFLVEEWDMEWEEAEPLHLC